MPHSIVFRRRTMQMVALLLFVASATYASSARVLIVGDSWAAGILGFKAFETILANHGVQDAGVVGATTALGGSRADQWASNHKGKLDTLRAALDENPTIDIVHISIGGNDFLRAAMEEGIVTAAPEMRRAMWSRIWNDIEVLINTIKECRPGIHIVLNDYDYLDPALMNKTFGLKFPDDVTVENLNAALVELAEFKKTKIIETQPCDYIQHFGVLQHAFGFPPGIAKGEAPLPGGPPDYAPFTGGNPAIGNSPEAMPDGVHPTPEGYVHIIERCYDAFYGKWLADEPANLAATKE